MKIRTGLVAVSLMAATAPWATYALILGAAVPVYLSLMVIGAAAAQSIFGETIYFGRPMVALLAYCGLIGVSVLWSMTPSFWAAWYNLASWTSYALAFFGVLNFLRDRRSLRWFVYASALGAIITLPLLAPYEGGQFLETSRYAVKGHNANFTAYVLAGAFFVIALALRYLDYTFSAKVLLMGALGVIIYSLLLMDTRGAQLSVLLSGMTIAWGRWVTRSMARIASFVAVLISLAFSLGLLTPFLVWVDSLSSRSTGDLSGRLIIWLDAIGFIIERPIFGIGPGSFLEVGTFELGVHNVFLLVLLDTGIVGLLVFMWFLIEVWRSILTLGKDGQRIFFAFLMYWLPMSISGHWETAPYSWGAVAFAINVARVLANRKVRATSVPVAPQGLSASTVSSMPAR